MHSPSDVSNGVELIAKHSPPNSLDGNDATIQSRADAYLIVTPTTNADLAHRICMLYHAFSFKGSKDRKYFLYLTLHDDSSNQHQLDDKQDICLGLESNAIKSPIDDPTPSTSFMDYLHYATVILKPAVQNLWGDFILPSHRPLKEY
jgi:hypothetical protein